MSTNQHVRQARRAKRCDFRLMERDDYWEQLDDEIPPATPDEDAYFARTVPRLAELDRLEALIDFSRHNWRDTAPGAEWSKLLAEQIADESASDPSRGA